MLASVCWTFGYAQPYHYKIAIIGSSTAFGTGASPMDSSWVNLTRFYFKKLGEIDTIYNCAVGGTFTGQGAGAEPDTGIVWVMKTYHPDVVIASYASNDAAADVPVDTTMLHLRTIYNTVVSAGKICYITTPHPRDYFTHYQDSLQLDVRDSTFTEFGAHSLDFWHCLVDADSVSIAPQYYFDGVHVNNAGHQQLFQVVKKANILAALIPPPPPPPPPTDSLTADTLTAVPQSTDVLLDWTAAQKGAVQFTLQRSPDSKTYTDIDEQSIAANVPGTSYSWKDAAPVAGRDYYRLLTIRNDDTAYSPVVSVDLPTHSLTADTLTAVSQGTDVLLNWTAAQKGAVEFTLQRSPDSSTYTDIDMQSIAANVPGTSYSWKDPIPLAGHNYYRLITSSDGDTSYSPVVDVEWSVAPPSSWGIGNIYPMPGGSQLMVTIGTDTTRNITLLVFDVGGGMLSSTPGIVTAPSTQFTLDIPNLTQGQYFLRAMSADGRSSIKAFLKW